MRSLTQDDIGEVGLLVVGLAGVATGIVLPEISAPFVLLFLAVAVVGAAGLTEYAVLQMGGYAVAALVALVGGTVRLVRFGGVELLAVLLLVVATIFSVRSVQYYRFMQANRS